MASTTNPSDNEAEDTKEGLQSLTSLWSSLQAKYEGTNITKTITRLLHMYQPEDGIDAYERLLKTVFVLLEDFDADGLRLLVSTIPLPKSSTDEVIRDVFFRATGFVRIDTPTVSQSQSLIPTVANPADDDEKRGGERETTDVTVARGTGADIQRINSDKITTKCCPASQMMPQDFYPFRGFPPVEPDFSLNQLPQKINYSSSSQVFSPAHLIEQQLEPVEAQGCKVNWMQAPFVLQSGNSIPSNFCGDFIVRTDDNRYWRVPVANIGLFLSCHSPSVQPPHPYQMMSANRHFLYDKNHSATSCKLNASSVAPPVDENFSKANKSSTPDESKKIEENSETSLLDNLTVSSSLAACIDRFLRRSKNSVDCTNKRTSVPLKKADTSNANFHYSKMSPFSMRDTSNLQNETDTSRNVYYKNCDVAAYKRQYYDAILSMQRAKAAGNSLTPITAPANYDSTYYEYLQQQHWLYQQQRLIMGHQYASQRLIQPEFSTLRNPYVRSNEWISNCTVPRHCQEPHAMNSPHYDANFYANFEAASQSGSQHLQRTPTEAKNPAKSEAAAVKLKEAGK